MTNYLLLLEKIRGLGMDNRLAGMFVKMLEADENVFHVSDEKKKWALERGFFPGRIELYGLTEYNNQDFVPDFQYYMLHPMNNHFLKWLDKTTMKYVLNGNGCECTMADYYVYIENESCGGRYTYLMDCPNDIPKDENFLWNLLKKKKILMMKPNSGTSGGFGVIKMELKDGHLFENNKMIDVDRFNQIRDSMRNYIVTEYCSQHHELAKVWNESECTLRVIMCKNPVIDRFVRTTWSCAGSFARFGTSTSGGTSNLSLGGVGVGFDFETGQYNNIYVRYKRFAPDGEWKLTHHPDSGIQLEDDKLPNWEYVKTKIEDICQHISSLDYLGLDIIITEDGMRLCEINSLPAMGYVQVMCGPTLKRKAVRDFFESKGLLKYDGHTFYQAYIDSQE